MKLKSFCRNHKKKIFIIFALLLISTGVFFKYYRVFIVWIPGWSIGIYESNANFELIDIVNNPIITKKDIKDHKTYFVADPFVFEDNGIFYLFFEPGIRTNKGRKGVINLAVSHDGKNFVQKGTVLEENTSIAFPIVYYHNDDYYMTVESQAAGNVRLFKAVDFPFCWQVIDTLLTGNFGDPAIYFLDSIYYLFASKYGSHDTHLFVSNSFNGPFIEHKKSPINVNNKKTGRMAGNIFQINDVLYRPVQDCERMYGEKVRLMEIIEISNINYKEKESSYSPVLVAGKEKWNSKKMHTMNIFNLKSDGSFSIVTDGDYLDYRPIIRIRRR